MIRRLRHHWNAYFFPAWPPRALALYRIAFFGLAFAYYVTVDFSEWARVSPAFWMPVSIFRFLPGPPHSPALLTALGLLWKTTLFFSAAGFVTRVSTITTAALGVFLLGLPNCFGKIDHLDSFTVLMLLVFAFARPADPADNPPAGEYAWPIRLGQVLFLLIFAAAGLAKWKQSGSAWADADNLRFTLLAHLQTHRPLIDIAHLPIPKLALSAAGAATLALELSAAPAIFSLRIRPFVIAALFILQLLIAVFLGVWFTPHLAGYLLFLPWKRFAGKPFNPGSTIMIDDIHLDASCPATEK